MTAFASFAPRRRCVILPIAVHLAAATQTVAENAIQTEPLRKACEFLWSQQAEDGGWHSQQYAVLRSGQALTPFILHTLLQVPGSIYARNAEDVQQALHFIRRHIDDRGALGRSDPEILEYPVYSTAYGLQCMVLAGSSDDFAVAAKMRKYLFVAQRSELYGFTPNSAAYGGWGFDWPNDTEPGHMDIAHTRRAIEALAACEGRSPNIQPSAFRFDTRMRAAEEFLRVLQKHPQARAPQPAGHANRSERIAPPYDGGFYFSSAVLAANKGREEAIGDGGATYFRSYATATCDGVLALLACGVQRTDERIARAAAWLDGHDDLTYPQGVPAHHPEPWGEAIRFYHYAVRGEAYDALRWPGDWKNRLAAEIVRHQAADGHFSNDTSPLMKEDDPLLCTALAAIALTHCSSSISGVPGE